ncbi:unnamed protein product [Closterium sp. Yama58-4]|nr:unnamed protein product [Closterium sp. Yama58-4]
MEEKRHAEHWRAGQCSHCCYTKEDVYRALDAWAAFQLDFPLLAVKRALRIMQQEGQWKRILQVCKWMLARGQGRTFGTYDLMMEAMAATGRHAELDGTWERIMGRHLDTVPRATFARVMNATPSDPIDMLPAYLWHKVFRYLLLPPGSSHPETPLVRGRRKFPWYLAATEQTTADRNLPVRFVDPDFSAAGQHWKNARSYGSGWALLCCAMASKRLLALVLSFSAHHPIALVYNDLHPQWNKSVAYFLGWRPRLKSLALTFTHVKQIDNLCSPRTKSFPALTSLSLKLRGCADKAYLFDEVEKEDDEDEAEENFWSWSLQCPNLRRLKLGRGKWDLRTVGFKSLRSLTLKHMDWRYVNLQNLGTVTPRLTEFVLYRSWDLDRPSSGPGGGGMFRFDLSKAHTVSFYFPQSSLTLSLTLSSSLKAFSAMGKQLVLSCKGTEPLALQYLSLYGQQRLVISSLRLASVRVAYLNGPPKDHHSRNEDFSSYLDSPALSHEHSHENSPDRESVHRRSSAAFSWAEWLAPIAPTVEVLIVRHGMPVQEVDAEWSFLRSLGIVVEREERFEVDLKSFTLSLDPLAILVLTLPLLTLVPHRFGQIVPNLSQSLSNPLHPSFSAIVHARKKVEKISMAALQPAGELKERAERREEKRQKSNADPEVATPSDPIDMLPAYLWHKVFRYLLLPPGSSRPETPLVRGRRKAPWYLTATTQPTAGRNLPVKFADPDFTPAGQHWKNARSYGSGWALLCCAMASKRLLTHVLSFSAHHPIALVYNELHPQWIKSVEFFLRQRPRLRSLALTFTNFKQLDYLFSPLNHHFPSLTSLTLKLRGCVDKSYLYDDLPDDCEDDADEMFWAHAFDCPALQRLKLGRGKWNLQEEDWAEEFQSLRSLTLKHMDWSFVDFEYLGTVTSRLTEFTLYHSWSLDRPSSGPGGGGEFQFDLSKAQTVRLYFPQRTLTLFLTFSRSLKAFTAMAKQLVLSCKSSTPLALQHLSLYGQQRLVISSLRLASTRVAYLNGPPKDLHACNGHNSSYPDSPEPSPEFSPEFSCVEWLGGIAPTVEVLIVRHGVNVEGVNAEWSSLRSLGIVVEREERFEVDLKVEKRRDDAIFFPTSTCEQRTLTSLREFCPSLALYCISRRSFYWEKQGKELPETPMVHVRKARSGVPHACFAEKRPKNVREKMHSVNRELVDGYSVDKEDAYMWKYKGSLWSRDH